MTKSTVLYVGILTLIAVTVAPAPVQPRVRDGFSVRLEGYIGTKPDSAPVEASWTVSVKGDPYKLFVTKLVVLQGNIAYYDIINALKPYKIALTVVGDDEQIDLFATAPAGQKISVMGFMQFAGGARFFMISSVDYVGPPASAEATPAP
jgi:hypothetical protein